MHNVVLCSEWSKDLYPENTGGKFTNRLHSNMNFSGENWSVALTDIVYTPDTWNNVRADSNDIQIRMKGFKKWGIAEYTLWCATPPVYDIVEAKATVTINRVGEACREQRVYYKSEPMPINRPVFKDRADFEFVPQHWPKNEWNKYYLDSTYKELPYTIWCAKRPIYDITGSECMVRIGRRRMEHRCTDETAYFTSEPMRIIGKPMFKPQVYSNREFDPATWHKDECNFNRVDILNPGPVAVDGWEYETVHVPVGFYGTFKKFAKAFNKAVKDGITKIFDRTHAHPVTTGLPKYTYQVYQPYEFGFFQKNRLLARFHKTLDEFDDDVADLLKVITGGHLWDTQSYIIHNLKTFSTMGQATILTPQLQTILDTRFNAAAEKYAWGGTVGEYIKLVDADNIWVTLTTYVKEEYVTVAALSIVEAFAKDTNFSMKINQHMQYQLGFTINALFDMGWVQWYARKKELETTTIPSLYWYGYDPPNLANNPLKSMCVHCDIIEGSYVGKNQSPLLRILPLNIYSHLVSYESFAVLQHRHINKNNVSTISIWITETPDGGTIDLRTAPIVKLQFKRNA